MVSPELELAKPENPVLIEKPRSHFSKMFGVDKGHVEQARAVLAYSDKLANAVRDGSPRS